MAHAGATRWSSRRIILCWIYIKRPWPLAGWRCRTPICGASCMRTRARCCSNERLRRDPGRLRRPHHRHRISVERSVPHHAAHAVGRHGPGLPAVRPEQAKPRDRPEGAGSAGSVPRACRRRQSCLSPIIRNTFNRGIICLQLRSYFRAAR